MLKSALIMAIAMFIIDGIISLNDAHLFIKKHFTKFSNVKNIKRNMKNEESRCCHSTNFGIIPFKILKLSTTGFSTPATPNIPAIINIVVKINSISTGPISSTAPVIDRFPVRINFISIVY